MAQSRPSDANTGGYGDGYANGAAVVQSGNSTRAAASLGAGGGGNGSNGGSGGVALNKYGFKTQSSGSIKVRLHLLHQLASADAAAAAAGEGAGGASSPCKRANSPQRRSPQRARKEVSLAVVLERARARLEDARAGGGEVAVREGVAAAAPFVRRQPEDAGVDEGGTARFSVAAGVSVGLLGRVRGGWGDTSVRSWNGEAEGATGFLVVARPCGNTHATFTHRTSNGLLTQIPMTCPLPSGWGATKLPLVQRWSPPARRHC